jgi:hypothetical protein
MPDFFRKIAPAEIAVWLLFGVAVVPLLVLALYNHPSPADDYCFAFMTRDHGFWHGQHAYYTGWTGRYFATFLFHATPLWAGWLGYFKVLPFALIGLLFHALFSLLGEVFPAAPARGRAALTAGFIAVYVSQVASLAEAFYWSTAVYVYLLPSILLLYLLTWALRLPRPAFRRMRPLGAVWAAFLVFAIVGSNEMTMLLTLYLLGAAVGYGLLFRKKVDGWLLALLVVAGASAYLMLSAPGNAARLGTNPEGGHAVAAIGAALKATATNGLRWLVRSPLLLLSLGLAFFLAQQPAFRLNEALRVPLWVALLGWIGAVALLFVPQFYGVGVRVPPPPRILNLTWFVFLLGWVYLVALARAPFGWARTLFSPIGLAIVTLLVGWCFLRSAPIRDLYRDWLTGTAWQFDRELTARYAEIEASRADTVRVAPLQHVPASLFVEDVRADPKFLWNTCTAEYFGKKAVVLAEKPN